MGTRLLLLVSGGSMGTGVTTSGGWREHGNEVTCTAHRLTKFCLLRVVNQIIGSEVESYRVQPPLPPTTLCILGEGSKGTRHTALETGTTD